MLNEENSVQVIDLMAEGARKQSLTAHFVCFSLQILRADRHVRRPEHRAAKSGQRKASFFLSLIAFDAYDFWVREHEFRFGIFSHAHIHDRELLTQPDLR